MDAADLDRFRQLVIPPARTDVWICPLDRLGAGVRAGWPATSGGFEAAVIRLLRD